MKKKELNNLRGKEPKELLDLLAKHRHEESMLFTGTKLKHDKNLKKNKNLKRDIAQILTIIKESQLREKLK